MTNPTNYAILPKSSAHVKKKVFSNRHGNKSPSPLLSFAVPHSGRNMSAWSMTVNMNGRAFKINELWAVTCQIAERSVPICTPTMLHRWVIQRMNNETDFL